MRYIYVWSRLITWVAWFAALLRHLHLFWFPLPRVRFFSTVHSIEHDFHITSAIGFVNKFIKCIFYLRCCKCMWTHSKHLLLQAKFHYWTISLFWILSVVDLFLYFHYNITLAHYGPVHPQSSFSWKEIYRYLFYSHNRHVWARKGYQKRHGISWCFKMILYNL